MPDHQEIELKLVCELSDLAALSRVKILAESGPPRVETLVSTYFDAPDRRLAKAGAALRIRDLGDGKRVQTLKTRGDGLFARGEWESATTASEPDVNTLAGTPAAELFSADDAIDPLFTVSVERSLWRLRYRRSMVEVAIDVGRIFKSEDPGSSLPVSEIELELKSGAAEDLFSLAALLMEAAPLRLGVQSKSARGHALLDGRVNDVPHAAPAAFGEKPSAAAAFRALANGCLTQLRMNEDILLRRREPEALHQARVAIRRLRSAFSLFGDLIEHPRTETLKDELKRLSAALGPARDLDVFLTETLPEERQRRPDETGLLNLEKQLQSEKSKAYETALAMLGSAEWRRLVVDLAGWINAGVWTRPKDPERRALNERRARDFAAESLERRFRQVRRKSRRIATISVEDRHQARIAAKKLRYGCEFFAPLFADRPKNAKRTAPFIKTLKRLQDRLGALNDIATGHELMADAASRTGRARSAAFAAGITAADVDARAEPLLKEASEARKQFAKAKPFWE